MTADEEIAAALAAPYTRIFLKQEDGGYRAFLLEFAGVMASGDTIEATNADLEAAIAQWVRAVFDAGRPIPPPIEFDEVLEVE